MASTLFDKVWDRHVVSDLPGGGALIYIDRHLVHEVTSPQAFDGLREMHRGVRRPDLTFATVDHNVPTDGRPVDETTLSGKQLVALAKNCKEFGVPLFGYLTEKQGIVHVIGPAITESPCRVSPSFAATAIRQPMALLARLHLG